MTCASPWRRDGRPRWGSRAQRCPTISVSGLAGQTTPIGEMTRDHLVWVEGRVNEMLDKGRISRRIRRRRRRGEPKARRELMTRKQRRFVEEDGVHLNSPHAAIRAGYSAKTAHERVAALSARSRVIHRQRPSSRHDPASRAYRRHGERLIPLAAPASNVALLS
jgi:hypothetical protein